MTELLFYADAYLRNCEAQVVSADERGIVLDRTVFYPLGGGQPGDVGSLMTGDGREVVIADTRKGDAPGTVLHIPVSGLAPLNAGDRVVAAIDWDRRHHHMRIHTCLHVLSAAVASGVTGATIPDGWISICPSRFSTAIRSRRGLTN